MFTPRIINDTQKIALLITKPDSSDSVTLFQFRKDNAKGDVEWEIKGSYAIIKNTGQPAWYTVYYFDTSSVCPKCPVAYAIFNMNPTSRRKVLLYSKEEIDAFEKEKGLSNTLSSKGCCWVKQKTKWKKGGEVSKNKNFQPGSKFISGWQEIRRTNCCN